MRFGDHPKLYDAIMQVLAELDWPLGVTVYADDTVKGYRVAIVTGDRWLLHTRQIVIALSVENSRDVVHAVRCQIEEMKRDLGRVTLS